MSLYFLESASYVIESSDENRFIMDAIYPKIEKTLKDSGKSQMFSRLVGQYVNNNKIILEAPGPSELLVFPTSEKEKYYRLFDIDEKEIKQAIKTAISHINVKAQFQLVQNNPIFCLFYGVLRFYTINKDVKGLNAALMITIISNYPSIFTKYFKYSLDPLVVQYTVDNLSGHFTLKNSNTIFEALLSMVQNSYKFHAQNFIKGYDKSVIAFIQRIRNDLNSFFRNFANVYMDNHKKGLKLSKQAENMGSDENGMLIQNQDNENNTNRVDKVTNNVMSKMLTSNLDMKVIQISAKMCQVSVSEMRLCALRMINKEHSPELRKMIEAICFGFLYETRNPVNMINSQDFLNYWLKAYKATNTKNEHVLLTKTIISKWLDDFEIRKNYKSPATQSLFGRAFLIYVLTSIQKYNQ